MNKKKPSSDHEMMHDRTRALFQENIELKNRLRKLTERATVEIDRCANILDLLKSNRYGRWSEVSEDTIGYFQGRIDALRKAMGDDA